MLFVPVTEPSELIIMLLADCALIKGIPTATNDVKKIRETTKAKSFFILHPTLTMMLVAIKEYLQKKLLSDAILSEFANFT